MRATAADALRVFRRLARNGELGRVQLAFAGFSAAEFAVWIAMLVYAFDQGGTTTAAVVAIVQLVPSALFAPIGGALADRYPPGRVLFAGYLAQTAAMAATGFLLYGDAPPPLVYAMSAVAATAVTITRPTQAILVPAVCRAPEDLTAANVVTSWVESGMVLVGPIVAGALLTVTSPATVFVVFAAVGGLSAILVAPLARRGGSRAVEVAESAWQELLAGFRVLAHNAPVRAIVLLLALAFVVWGALDVLAVVLAIDVLDLGDAGAGWLTAAFGLGGLLGATGAALLVGRARLLPAILLACALWGAAFAALGAATAAAAAIALLVTAGVGYALLDVAGRTLLQRIAPPDAVARVFGVHECLMMVGLAIGSALVPPLVGIGGPALACAAIGALLPVVALLMARTLRRADRAAHVPLVELSLLRTLPIFSALPMPALEATAAGMTMLEVPAGTGVVTEGEEGDRYYAIADGEFEVTRGGAFVARLARGEGFGEIALLRDVPRTASVRAATDGRLYALDRETFVVAVTGHEPTARAAAAVVDERGVGNLSR